MHCCRNVFGISAIAGAAFVAGLFVNGATSSSIASMQDPAGQDAMQDEMMQAYMESTQIGEHHERLGMFVGNWDAVVRFRMAAGAPMEESTGTVSREWVLDKHFVRENVTATAGEMGEFKAVGYMGYNNTAGQYESVWLENFGTAVMTENGVFSPEEDKFLFFGNHRMPDGSLQMSYSEIDVSNPDRHVMTGWTVDKNGQRYKSFEGVFERTD